MPRKSVRLNEVCEKGNAPDWKADVYGTQIKRHQFLTVMRYPTYRTEDADAGGVADVAGLGGPGRPPYLEGGGAGGENGGGNRKKMRTSFTWRELYTIDPVNALKVRAPRPLA